MSTLVQSMQRYIEAHGGTIITGDPVSEILVKDDRAVGARTSSGKMFNAKEGVISNIEPKALFTKLVPESATPEDFRKKVRAFRFSKCSEVMIHAALDDWLDYRPQEIQKSGLVQIGDSLDQVSRAFNDCVIGQPPSEPFMTIDNTSCYDATRAPKGKHTLWNFVRAPLLVRGKPWTEDQKEDFCGSVH
ncbi:MAG: hypothetical protein OK457_02925 [Thaumarchaeota archaeon]|nr:hypothetical protein [Nitrososphaerota archaeon]